MIIDREIFLARVAALRTEWGTRTTEETIFKAVELAYNSHLSSTSCETFALYPRVADKLSSLGREWNLSTNTKILERVIAEADGHFRKYPLMLSVSSRTRSRNVRINLTPAMKDNLARMHAAQIEIDAGLPWRITRSETVGHVIMQAWQYACLPAKDVV